MNCKGCHAPVTDDGHGELVHVIEGVVTEYKYGCTPNDKRATVYPVAR
jgi:hypothetical protein